MSYDYPELDNLIEWARLKIDAADKNLYRDIKSRPFMGWNDNMLRGYIKAMEELIEEIN